MPLTASDRRLLQRKLVVLSIRGDGQAAGFHTVTHGSDSVFPPKTVSCWSQSKLRFSLPSAVYVDEAQLLLINLHNTLDDVFRFSAKLQCTGMHYRTLVVLSYDVCFSVMSVG